MEEKEKNDLLLSLIYNPDFSMLELRDIGGMTVENTEFHDKATYKANKKIQKLFLDENGQFDESKFNKIYDTAEAKWKYMNSEYYLDEQITKFEPVFSKYNLSVPKELREEWKPTGFEVIRISNPDLQKVGTIKLGHWEDKTKSRDEIAQSLPLLTNPVDVANGHEAKWGEAPGTGIFTKNFWKNILFDTLILATWDEDGEHTDPVTGYKMQHKKGEPKLNDEGYYYYEALDGRSVYGKQVLSKMNVISPDTAKWNRIDIFDSDGVESNITKTVLKNLALVGTMFVPYVGPYLRLLSILNQGAGIFGTLGNMVMGGDSPTFSAIEGWSKSMNRLYAKSELAQQSFWGWENIINLAGDVAGQIAELRFLFNYLPAIRFKGKSLASMKGTKAANEAKRKALFAEELRKAEANFKEPISKLAEKGIMGNPLNQVDLINKTAADALKAFEKSYNNLGYKLSTLYMTGITVEDSYGEMIAAGIDPITAAITTLLYGGAEYALLRTNLGKIAFPELRQQDYYYNALMKTAAEAMGSKPGKAATKEARENWVKSIAVKVRDVITGKMAVKGANGTKALSAILSASLGEGTEEVSEELLRDVSYQVLNWVQDGRGAEAKMSPWENMGQRYLINFIGGVFGGAFANTNEAFRITNLYNSITQENVVSEIVHMVAEGEIDEFQKYVKKHKNEFGNPRFSAKKYNSETKQFELYNKNDPTDISQADEVVTMTDNLIRLVKDVLNGNDLNYSQEEFARKYAPQLQEIKGDILAHTVSVGRLFKEYHDLRTKLVGLQGVQSGLQASKTDSTKNETTLEETATSEEIAKTLELLEEYRNGNKNFEIVRDVLFELHPTLNNGQFTFHQYAEYLFHTPYELLSDSQREEAKNKYNTWIQSEASLDIHEMALQFEKILHESGNTVLKYIQEYSDLINDVQLNDVLTKLTALSKIDFRIPESSIANNLNPIVLRINTLLTILDVFDPLPEAPENPGQLPVRSEETSDELWLQILNDWQVKFENYENWKNSTRKGKIIDILNSESATLETQPEDILRAQTQILLEFQNELSKHLDNVVDLFNNLEFLNPELKTKLINSLNFTNPLIEDAFNEIARTIHSKVESPALESLKSFTVDYLGKMTPKQLLDNISNLLYQASTGDLSLFAINDSSLNDSLDEAIQLVKEYISVLNAFRYDNVIEHGNLFGYSNVLNQLGKNIEGYQELPEIDKLIADVFIVDAQAILNKLLIARNLHNLNVGKKLSRLDEILVHTRYATYNSLNNWISRLSDSDFDGLDELKEAFAKMEYHKEHWQDSNLKLSDEDMLKLEQEKLDFEDALFDFMQKNQSKLTNPETLLKFFDIDLLYTKAENLATEKDDILDGNETSRTIDGNAFFWYLISHGALQSSQFYSELYKELQTELEELIAPLDPLLSHVFLQVANVVNGEFFDNILPSLLQAILLDWKNKTIEQREEVLSKIVYDINAYSKIINDDTGRLLLDLGFAPLFSAITFSEGMPGTGKSNAVFPTSLKLIKRLKNNALNNVIVVSVSDTEDTNKSNAALNLLKKLKIEHGSSYSHLGLMRLFVNDYDSTYDTYHYETNKFVSNMKLKAPESQNPTLIIIDEILRLSFLDLLKLEEAAKERGFRIIGAGDLEQTGNIITKLEGTGKVQFILNRTQLPRARKLSSIIRSGNTHVSNSISSLLSFMRGKTDQLDFHYYLDQSTNDLYGVVNSELILDELYPEEGTQSILEKMISNLDEGEKIGYIYDDEESDMFLYIMSHDSIKEHVEFYKGNTAQSRESKYFIVDLKEASNKDAYYKENPFIKDLYTSISRGSIATIVIGVINELVNYIEDSTLLLETMPLDAIISSINKFMDRLSKLKFNPKGSSTTTPSSPTPLKKNYISPTILQILDNPTENLLATGVQELPTPELEEVIDLLNDQINPPDVGLAEPLLLFSFNTFLNGGYSRNSNGTAHCYIDKKIAKSRIDGINGLKKIPGLGKKSYDEYMKILGDLFGHLINRTTNDELINSLKESLGIASNERLTVDFGIKSYWDSSVKPGENYKYWFYNYDPEEKVSYIRAHDTKSEEPVRKQLIATITVNTIDPSDGKQSAHRLEVPLFSLNNHATIILLTDKDGKLLPLYEELAKEWRRVFEATPKEEGKFHAATRALIDYINNNINNLNNFIKPYWEKILTLAKLFDYTRNDYFKIGSSEEWLPAVNLEKKGITHALTRGITHLNLDLLYLEGKYEWTDISKEDNTRLHFSELITETNKFGFEKTGLRAGWPFVLVSDDPMFTTTGDMYNRYKAQLKDPTLVKSVFPLYLKPPRASLRQFIINLHRIFNKEEHLSIGNSLTAFRVFSRIIERIDSGDITLNESLKLKLRISDNYFDLVKKLIEQVKSSNFTNEELLEYLLDPSTALSKGTGTTIPWKELNNILHDFVYDETLMNGKQFIESRMKFLEENYTDDISYNYYETDITERDKSKQNGFLINRSRTIRVYADENCTTFKDAEFGYYGKIETTMFKGDSNFYDFLKSVVQTIDEEKKDSRNVNYADRSTHYMMEEPVANTNNSSITLSDRDIINEILKEIGINLKSLVRNNRDLYFEEIVSKINSSDKPYFALYINGGFYAFPTKYNESDWKKGRLILIGKIKKLTDKEYSIHILMDGNTYDLTFNDESGKITIPESLISPTQSNEFTEYTDYEAFKPLIEKIKDNLNQKMYENLMSHTSFEQLSGSLIRKLSKELELNPDLIIKENDLICGIRISNIKL